MLQFSPFSTKNLQRLAMSLLVAGVTIAPQAEALIRITPKDGYGHSTESFFDPITDFLLKMTLHEDLVFRTVKTSTGSGSDFMVYSCPTVYRCTDKASCLTQPEYWNCQVLYREDSSRTCRRYKQSQVVQSITKFIVTEAAEDVATAPINFLQHGIGLVVSDATVIPDALDARENIRESDCRFLEDMTFGAQTKDAQIHLRKENSKGDIRNLLSTFAPGYNMEHTRNIEPMNEKPAVMEQLQPDMSTANSNGKLAEGTVSGDPFFDVYLPFLQKNSTTGQFTGARNKKISYIQLKVANPKGVMVLAPGQGDPAMKYAEFAYNMRDKLQDGGYDLFIIDHRGQGQSEPLLRNPQKGHVDAFSDYVDDMQNFVHNIVHVERYSTSVVISDSMGGGITAGFLQREPHTFARNIFVSPMWGINVGQFVPDALAKNYASLSSGAKLDTQYAPGEDNYNPYELLKNSDDTSSAERFATQRRLYVLYPELARGGVTNGWLNESLKFTAQLQQDTQFIQVPTLVFQAGADNTVSKPAQTQICTKFASLCELVLIDGSKHDILIEQDKYRDQLMAKINEFLAR